MPNVAGARAHVLEAGSVLPLHSLTPGDYTIEISDFAPDGGRETPVVIEQDGQNVTLHPTEFGERYYVTFQYPQGYSKTHHVKTAAELLPKIANVFRYHFGVATLVFKTVPDSLVVGSAVVVTVA